MVHFILEIGTQIYQVSHKKMVLVFSMYQTNITILDNFVMVTEMAKELSKLLIRANKNLLSLFLMMDNG